MRTWFSAWALQKDSDSDSDSFDEVASWQCQANEEPSHHHDIRT